jgi:hypothetical protein
MKVNLYSLGNFSLAWPRESHSSVLEACSTRMGWQYVSLKCKSALFRPSRDPGIRAVQDYALYHNNCYTFSRSYETIRRLILCGQNGKFFLLVAYATKLSICGLYRVSKKWLQPLRRYSTHMSKEFPVNILWRIDPLLSGDFVNRGCC